MEHVMDEPEGLNGEIKNTLLAAIDKAIEVKVNNPPASWGLFTSSLVAGRIFLFFLLLIILVYRGSMGWGDVKRAGLIGLVTGFPAVLVTMEISFVSGGLVAIFLILLRRRTRKKTVPLAPFLSLGAFAALLWGEAIFNWYSGFWSG